MIVDRERNVELRALYELCWHLGGSQTDIANLTAENIDWSDRVIAYARRKTGSPAFIHFGPAVETILRSLPSQGLLLPKIALWMEKHRAKEFKRRCVGLGNCHPTVTLGCRIMDSSRRSICLALSIFRQQS